MDDPFIPLDAPSYNSLYPEHVPPPGANKRSAPAVTINIPAPKPTERVVASLDKRNIKPVDPNAGRDACLIILITSIAVGILLSQGHVLYSIGVGLFGLLALSNRKAAGDVASIKV